ncbi:MULTISPECIES: cohesin domain-containing protein [unclassified Nocardioides]|uniref:cohesin domain-containing protein n=1 Tax=unclassified Nocardioides TaxID=2615069 RepID=UPI0030142AF4
MSAIEKRKQMSKRRQQIGGVAALALGLGALAWIPNAVAGPDDTVITEAAALDGYGIEVSADEVVVGDTVTVKVTATDVSDLYAYDLKLAYDADVLDYVDDSASTDLTGSTYGLESAGAVEVVHTKLGTSPAATGPVTLAEVTFTAVGVGPAAVSAPSLETVTTARTSTTTTGIGVIPVEALAKAAPVATTAPKVSGTVRVGRTLAVSGGSWDVSGVSLAYQWRRAGRPVAGATGRSYVLRPADADALVDVVVSAAKKDHVTGSATAAAGTVARATTSTRVAAPRTVKKGKRPTVRIAVASSGITPAGTVKVTYGGKVVKAAATLKNGKVTVTLPRKKAGSYRLKVVYRPAVGFTASSKTVTVRVRR